LTHATPGAGRTPALCIRNPASGNQPISAGTASQDAWPDVVRILEDSGFDLRIEETGDPEPSAAELAARAIRDGIRTVFVGGGDGTVAQAATALLDTGAVLGILPFGSVMNIANSIELPLEPIEAARVLAQRHVRRIDVGEVNGHVFYEAAGVGLDADAFGAARAMEKGNWRQALRRVRRTFTRSSHRFTIRVDGKESQHRALQILIANGRYYAWSFPVVPDADVGDGLFDIVVFPRMGRLALLRQMFAIWRGADLEREAVVFHAAEAHVDSLDRVPVHADGVVAGTLPLTFRCRRGALAVYGPQ
jgi:diacylglycerol kinase (ATP)